MPNEKHFVFSARTTEKGLRLLNDLKGRLGVSWDELIVDAVAAKYHIDKAEIELPKKVKTPKPKAEKKTKTAGKPKAKATAKEKHTTE